MNQIKCGRGFFVYLIFCASFSLFCTAKTGQWKPARNDANDFKANGFSWLIIREGWVGRNSFQAYTNGAVSNGLAYQITQTRERLFWLLLMDSYKLTESDKSIAASLARSSILKN